MEVQEEGMYTRGTHWSLPIAGPPGTKSETITAVSPVPGFGLSLPPEMAKPNPNLLSYQKNKKRSVEKE